MRRFIPRPSGHDLRAAFRVGLSVGLSLLAIFAVRRLDFAVFAAFGSLASLYGHGEKPRRRIETQLAAGLALTATIAVATSFAAAQGSSWLLGLLLFVTVIAAGTLGAVMAWKPRGEIFFVLVLLVLAGIPADWTRMAAGTAIGLAAAAFCVLLTLLDGMIGNDNEAASSLRRRLATGFSGLDRRQHALAIATSATGALIAWLAALALGIGHPYWAPIVVTAVMPTLLSASVREKVLNLTVGTLGGVAIAAVVFAFQPGPLALILLIALWQAAAEMIIARNYGLALLFLSPLAIGMSNLGRGLPWGPLIADRLVEAVVGVAVGLAVILAARHMAGIRAGAEAR